MNRDEPFFIKDKPLEYLHLPKWKERFSNLAAGFSTRNGGQSSGDYKSMNLGLHVGDNKDAVIANREMITSALGFSMDAWTSADQVHGNNIKIITEKDRGKGRYHLDDAVKNTDGIVTNLEDILLTSFYADCVPLYFLDPVHKVVGLAHAGWKGTAKRIAEKMVSVMVDNFHSKPENIQTVIGPAIDQCCYEVSDTVISSLKSEITSIPDSAIIDKHNGHYDLDLKKINRQILLNAGIQPQNIEMSLWCTSCNKHLFYSHRRDNGKTGRMISWIGWRKDE